MIVRTAKNIAIIILEHDDLYNNTNQKRDGIVNEVEDLISSEKLNTMYKIHLIVDEDQSILGDGKFKLVDRFRIYGKRLHIHSFCRISVIPDANNISCQEYAISDTKFIKIRKRHNKILISEYRRQMDNI